MVHHIHINPLWVPHMQRGDYDDETYRILFKDGYVSECMICFGMCNIRDEAYWDSEEDGGPICTRECYDVYLKKNAHVGYELLSPKRQRYSDAAEKQTQEHLINLIENSFSEDMLEIFDIDVNLLITFREKNKIDNRR